MDAPTRRLLASLILPAAGGLPLAAQAPPKAGIHLTADLGFVNTAGNTDATTINTGERLSYVGGSLRLVQEFALVYGRTDGQTTASFWRAGLNGEYALSPLISTFTQVRYERNRFAGVARRLEEDAGATLHVVRQPRDSLDFDAGLGFAQQRSTEGAEDNFTFARAAARYGHHFTTGAAVTQALEAIQDLRDGTNLRVNSETSLTAALSSRLAVKTSYVIRFANEPIAGFRKTDRFLTAGLQVTL